MNDIKSLDAFTTAYIRCALWASSCAEGTPLDEVFTAYEIDGAAFIAMVADCERFQRENAALLEAWYELGEDSDSAGHDFWLTRNEHGAGFWSRPYDEPGEFLGQELTDAAEAYGSSELYVGDDGGTVFLSGVAYAPRI